MVTFGGYTVKAQLEHLFVCGKHNSQMFLYVKKCESLKLYLKLLNLRLLDFQGSNHCSNFFMVAVEFRGKGCENKGCELWGCTVFR